MQAKNIMSRSGPNIDQFQFSIGCNTIGQSKGNKDHY